MERQVRPSCTGGSGTLPFCTSKTIGDPGYQAAHEEVSCLEDIWPSPARGVPAPRDPLDPGPPARGEPWSRRPPPPAPPNPTTPPSSPGATFCLLEEALESHVFAPFSHRSHLFFLKRVWTHNFRTTLAPEPPFSLSGEALESHFRTTLAPEPLFFK